MGLGLRLPRGHLRFLMPVSETQMPGEKAELLPFGDGRCSQPGEHTGVGVPKPPRPFSIRHHQG